MTVVEYKLVGHGPEELLTLVDRPLNECVFDLWLPIEVKRRKASGPA